FFYKFFCFGFFFFFFKRYIKTGVGLGGWCFYFVVFLLIFNLKRQTDALVTLGSRSKKTRGGAGRGPPPPTGH
ncbi:hypothetical protein ACVGXN_07180, partial [Enterobacter hormaechei]